MGRWENLSLNQLKIWSDNPRYGNLSTAKTMDEKVAINLLIDVVGEKKMANLINDILDSKGLNGNVSPTVVYASKQYCVYDGNRRVSSLKIIKNPDILDESHESLKSKVKDRVKNRDLSFADEVHVYITDEREALSLMDKTHSGDLDGVGVISWDAFNRDISLNRRGLKELYPVSYKVVSVLQWKLKKDFLIPYTDFQRLFNSKVLLDTFGIVSISKKYSKQISTAVNALLAYKTERGFKSFSRQFNIIDTEEDESMTKPINEFISFWKQKQLSESQYKLTISQQIIYSDSAFSFDYNSVKIFDNNTKNTIETISDGDLTIQYFDPTGKQKNKLDPRVAGMWKIRVFYKGVSGSGVVIVKTPLENPVVKFGNTSILRGESLDLNSCVTYSYSSHYNDMKLISIKSVGDKEPIIGPGNIFSGGNEKGTYKLSFCFDNDGREYSVTKDITVKENKSEPNNNCPDLPFQFDRGFNISFSNHVYNLVQEINSLWKTNKYIYVICCSARAVLELSLNFINSSDPSIFSSCGSALENEIIALCEYFLNSTTILTNMSTKLKKSYKNLKNELTTLKDNALNLMAALNLGAHKSGAYLDKENLYNKMRIYIRLVIELAEGFNH